MITSERTFASARVVLAFVVLVGMCLGAMGVAAADTADQEEAWTEEEEYDGGY